LVDGWQLAPQQEAHAVSQPIYGVHLGKTGRSLLRQGDGRQTPPGILKPVRNRDDLILVRHGAGVVVLWSFDIAQGGRMRMHVSILGSGGGAPPAARETSCVLIRDGDRALLLDMGTGARRLLADPTLLHGVTNLHVALTRFHFDHVCGLPYLPWLSVDAAVWAPGRWLYGRDGAEILEPLRRPPLEPSDVTETYPIRELGPGNQVI